MTTTAVAPWGLSRMKPFPASTVLACAAIVLDPDSQTGRWIAEGGDGLPMMDRHKRSETSQETSTKTSLDGNPDQGSDQSGDSD